MMVISQPEFFSRQPALIAHFCFPNLIADENKLPCIICASTTYFKVSVVHSQVTIQQF